MGKIFSRGNLTIPNLMSAVRILLIPFVAYFYLTGNTSLAVMLVVISGLSDLFDGLIARKFNQVTELGKMLDPLADKLTQGVIAICLAFKLPEIRAVLFIFVVKELTMLCGAFVLIKKKKKPCAAQWYGKVATTLFYVTVIVILMLQHFKPFTQGTDRIITFGLLIITAVFMLYALVRYVLVFLAILRSDDDRYYFDWQEKRQSKKQEKIENPK